MRRFLQLLILTVFLAACSSPSARIEPTRSLATVSPATSTPLAVPSPSVTASPAPSATATVAPTPTLTAKEACGSFPCQLTGHFLFQRPIGLTGKQSIERAYPYGSNQGGKLEVHHGVEFYNAQGTPVLAAADGKVVFAGNDQLTLLSWVTGYYGNVVVLEHHFPGFEQTFYTLYGHLFKLNVTTGQEVKAGEILGQVGATGTARGSHLHFEVRIAENNYKSNRNPELWLAPLPGTGVLAGRIVDAQGNLLKGNVNLQRIENGVLDPLPAGAVEAYAHDAQRINADDTWQENFTLGELPAGEYRLTMVANGILYEQKVTLEAGRLTLVEFLVK
jgi:murein DD-endopeptidase MepM/ murein hydrolase activator NlpD